MVLMSERSRRPIPWMLIALVALGVGLSIAAAPAPAVSAAGAPASIESRVNAFGNGLGQLTGIAVSPLLVLSIFGAIDWYGAVAGEPLPLHASPWVWGTAITVAAIALLVPFVAGTAAPGPVAKFAAAARYLEEQFSGLIAAGIFLPTLSVTLSAAGLAPSAAAAADAPIQAGVAGGVGAGVLVTIVFLIVRVVSLTIDALIMLSPFVAVDAVLVSVRTSVLGIILGSMLIHPVLALVVCSLFVVGCALIFGWCVRVNLFAGSCMWDVLTMRWRRARASEGPMRAFMASGRQGPAIRTRGMVEPTRGGLRFRWRPWFVLPERSIDLPASRAVVVRGIIWSSIAREDGSRREELVLLPPRYLSHEEVVAGRVGGRVEDGVVRRSIRQTIEFVRGVVSWTSPSQA
jgi:hypothetical protein